MIKTITITNYLGESVKVKLGETEPTHGLFITEIDGLGPVKADINTSTVAVSDGTVFNSARANERNIVMKIRFMFAQTIEDSRQLTYKYFPLKHLVKVRVETDNRTSEATGYVESNEPEIFSEKESTKISILCPDPNFYSLRNDRTVFSGVYPKFEFPFENNSLTEKLIEMGSIQNKTYETVTYTGDGEVGVTIKIHALGSVGTFTIYNINTRESMKISADKISQLTGSSIVKGDDIIISTVKGDKYITLLRDGVLTNILNALERGTDWFQLAKGENIFAFVAESGTTNLQFAIENRVAYEGI